MRSIGEPPDDRSDDPAAVLARLASPPRIPTDISRFTPDLYPAGPPLAPAAGALPDAAAAHAELLAAGAPEAAARLDDPDLVARAPDPGVRAGLASLTGTVAEPALVAFVAGELPIESMAFGALGAPTRVVGTAAGAPPTERRVNERYAAEHPVLLAPSLAHDLLWRSTGAGKVEETILHAVAAMVHVQRLAAAPALADLRTELARRQHSLALALLLSRHPASADLTLVAPDGLGTLPGGAPALATPDFWSVPFGSGPSADPDAPAPLVAVLRHAYGPGAPVPEPLGYDDALVALCARPLGDDWLSPAARLRVVIALGLVDP